VRRSEEECSGVWWSVVECGGGGGVWWRWWSVGEGGCVVTSLISIQYVIILCNDVTRACSGETTLKLYAVFFHLSDTQC
jgi:hypothetical protein